MMVKMMASQPLWSHARSAQIESCGLDAPLRMTGTTGSPPLYLYYYISIVLFYINIYITYILSFIFVPGNVVPAPEPFGISEYMG